MLFKAWTTLVLLFSISASAQSGPSNLNVSGVLYSSTGDVINNPSVNFKLEVWDKAATCILYSEEHLGENLSTSKGNFSLPLGKGSSINNYLESSSVMTAKVFENSGAVAGGWTGCASGTTLSSGDERLIRLYYDLGGGYVAMNPDVPLASSAYAMVAQTLQGKAASDFVQLRDDASYDLNQANVENVFSSTNYARLLQLLNPSAALGFGSQRLTNLADPTSAQDASTKNYSDSNLAGKNIDLSDVGSGTGGGKVLMWDQSQNKWVASAPSFGGPAGGDLTGTYPNPTVAALAIGTSKLADSAVTSAKINSTGISTNRILITDGITGSTVTYKACANDEVLKFVTGTGWACATVASLAPVTSVNGKTGVVTLNAADLSLGTAALKDYGTAAGNLVELDAGAKIPTALLPNLAGDVTGAPATNVVTAIQGRAVASTAPNDNEVLKWNQAQTRWEPAAISSYAITALTGDVTASGTGSVTATIGDGKVTTAKLFTNPGVNRLVATDSSTGATLSAFSCTLNQIMQWGASGWACQDVSSVIGGSGIVNGGNSFSAPMTIGTNDAQDLNLETTDIPRLTILATGNVGIGTTSPSEELEVNINQNSRTAIQVKNTDTGTSAVASFRAFNSSTNMSLGHLGTGYTNNGLYKADGSYLNGGGSNGLSIAAGSIGTGVIRFYTGGTTDTDERMRITASGYVGIGTTTPARLLHVAGPMRITPATLPSSPAAGDLAFDSGAANALKFYDGSSWQTVGTGSGSGDFKADGSVPMTGNLRLNGNFLSGDGGSEGIFVDSSGNVGVGTSLPTANLMISKSDTSSSLLVSNSNSSTSQYPNITVENFRGSTSGHPFFALDNSGGTQTLPSAMTPTQSVGAMIFRAHDGTSLQEVSRIIARTGDNFSASDLEGSLSFYTRDGTLSDKERVRITPTGYVGIGTTAPARQLEVAGPMRITPATLPSSPAAGDLAFDSGAANALKFYDGSSWQTVGTGTGSGDFKADGSVPMTGNLRLNGNFLSGDGGSEGIFVDSSGNVGIGTTSPGLQTFTGRQYLTVSGSSDAGVLELSNNSSGAFKGLIQVVDQYNTNADKRIGYIVARTVGAGTDKGGTFEFFTKAADGALGRGLKIDSNQQVGVGVSTVSSKLDVGGNFSTTSWTTTGAMFNVTPDTITDTTGTGAVGPRMLSTFQTPTLASTNAVTIDNAATLYIAGAPIAGTNTTIANPLSLYVASGNSSLMGNVGIGTTSPSYKLDVAGTIRSSSGGIMFPDGTTQTTAAGGGGSGQWGYSNPNLYYTAGNVGIGTSNPTTKLDVSLGFIGVSNGYGIGYGPSTNFTVGSSAIQSYGLTFAQGNFTAVGTHLAGVNGVALYTNNAERIRIDTNGNVGIGTTNPSTPLQVQKDQNATTVIEVRNSAGTAAAQSLINVAADVASGGIMAYSSTSPQIVWTMPNQIALMTSSATTNGLALAARGASAPIIFAAGGDVERMRLTSTGNVGIGTTAPSYKLDVAGTIRSSSGGIMFPDGTTQTTAAGGGGAGQWGYTNPNVYYTAGNVGVGTSTPDSKFRVVSSVDNSLVSVMADTSALDIANSSSAPNAYAMLRLGSWAGGTVSSMDGNYIRSIGVANNNVNLAFGRFDSTGSTSEFMRFGNNGYLGIGTTNPTVPLDVKGDLQTRPVGNHFLKLHVNDTINGDIWSNYGDLTFSTTTSQGERMRITYAGNVGIGTTSPTGQLHVYGTSQTTSAFDTAGALGGSIVLQDYGNTTNSGGAVVFGSRQGLFASIKALNYSGSNNTAGDLAFSTRNLDTDSALTERMRVRWDGKVGIGTTAPARLLEVAGPMRITPTTLPSSPAAGDLAFDSGASNALKFYNGTSWQTVGTGSGGGDFMKDGSVAMTGNIRLNNNWLSGDGGNEGVFVDSAGKVGIGTTTPSTSLSVSTANANGLDLMADTTAGTMSSRLFLSTSTPGQSVSLMNSAGAFRFSTGGTPGTATGNEAMRITTAGNVGIGTTNPGATLTVVGGSGGATLNVSGSNNGNTAIFSNSTYGGGLRVDGIVNYTTGITASKSNITRWFYGSNVTSESGSNSGSDFTIERFNDAGTSIGNALLINRATGYVGIGTSSPNSILDINGSLTLRGSTSGYSVLRSPAAAGNVTWTLPAADGTNGQILSTNGAGQLGWTNASGSGTVTSVNLSMPGIFSVSGGPVTTSGTLAVTASGTSGGIPYFSSATALASSAALTQNGIVLGGGAGAAPTSLSVGASGTLLTGTAAAPSFSATPTLGVAGTTKGTLSLTGNTSGTITIQPQAAAGSYNFNLPTGAGTSGQPLLSGGGGTTAMTFGTLGVAAGGTGLTSGTQGGIPYFSGSTTMASSAALTQYQVVLGGGTGAPTVVSGTGTSGQVLTSNGTGAAPTWQAAATGASPAGSGSEIQFRSNATTFGANSTFVWDNTNSRLGVGTATPSDRLTIYGTGTSAALAIATAGTAGTDQSSLGMVTLASGTASLGQAGTKGWSVYARGNAYSTTSAQNTMGFSYWDGSSWTNTLALHPSGNVGVGIAIPTSPFHVYKNSTVTSGTTFASRTQYEIAPSATSTADNRANFVSAYFYGSNSSNAVSGTSVEAYNDSTATLSYMTGLNLYTAHTNSGTTSSMMAMNGSVDNSSTAGTITTATAGYFSVLKSGSGSIGTGYGVYVGSVAGTSKWSIYSSDSTAPSYFAGNVGIGVPSPTNKLEVSGSVKIVDGNQASGKVLTSDASGVASWQTPTATSSATMQSFTASGTWTKPSTGSIAEIECWGAGGGGARHSSLPSGGGGGGYTMKRVLLSTLGATETVTIGTGGAGSSTNAAGGQGGDSSFGSVITAYGGAGGPTTGYGGGGGGPLGAGSGSSAGAPSIGQGTGGEGATPTNCTGGVYHGGGGGAYAMAGCGSIHGGGGGGGAPTAGSTVYAGGTSLNGGAGGASSATGTAGNGTVPGGGGGGSRTGTSGAGANGMCRITIW